MRRLAVDVDDEREPALPARPIRAARSARGARPAPSPPATILLADDDDSFRSTLRGVLEEEGYAVLEASNGVDTIELLASAADGNGPIPDVVVLDVCMPGYSGLGVLSVMRRFSGKPRVIVVTGFVDPSIEVFASRLGAAHVMRKPVDLDRLLSKVLAAASAGGSA